LEKMVIIVEHDFAFLGQFVDSLYVMESWNNFAKGTYEQIKNNKAVKEIYFW
jgi:ABC-type branched-subunit amino acid transport system ATPase component